MMPAAATHLLALADRAAGPQTGLVPAQLSTPLSTGITAIIAAPNSTTWASAEADFWSRASITPVRGAAGGSAADR